MSVGVWQMACKRVLKVGERIVKEISAGELLWDVRPVIRYSRVYL